MDDRSTDQAARTNRALKTLVDVFRSGRPLVYIRSSEEGRVASLLRECATQINPGKSLPLWTWSLTEGLARESSEDEAPVLAKDPREALDFIAAHHEPAIFHLKDFHEPLRDSAAVRRRLRDLYDICLDKQKFIVITSPIRFIPEEVERSFIVIDLPPPDLPELADFLRAEVFQNGRGESAGGEETIFQVGRALQGLSLDEARHAVRRALAANPVLDETSLPALFEEKKLLINRTGVIEFISDSTNIGEVGGLETLKQWLMERRKLFNQRDSLDADIVPKGILMMGIPGCGKSLSARAIASCFQLPLYRIDMIDIFSGRHGEPEGAFVQACRTLESMAPAIIWFDEIEMAITSTESAGQQGRIFAFFLTWMQDKSPGLFVAATANRIDLLPAEMIRKGRFDEVFFVDLPHDQERAAIFKIHLARRGVDASKFDFELIVESTREWTGAEIEQCVVAALTKARIKERAVTENDIIDIAAASVPLARAMKEQINHIRQWAFQRAVRASPVPIGR
ncbi:MAG TPA: AAA family ATPase [Candidatus Binataceae bacterium]|nr:AAA family ATPase [Candidatus Binataceae bacterium]